jgi:hypothetical protein
MTAIRIVGFVCLNVFVAIKVGGTALAAWSWWWLLMTPVPVFWLLLSRLGVA